ncbi:hypothetical protein [Actinoplanes sp. GCM10030250]|uniref:hypothetical protein n=1 Tax=Actinoplanes sp. GCM10030250 TaxID=3273376 RepID=UPI00360FB25B
MSVTEPTGTPDIERPIDLVDDPHSKPGPAPAPEHHPHEDDTPPGGSPEPGTAPGH